MRGKKSFNLPEGYDLRAFDILDSTNMQCCRMVDEGISGNIWVMADVQSAGKGRRGRHWVSGRGNLFASLLYNLDCDLSTASELSFVTALAVRDVIADILQSDGAVTCKWPNDILVGGKKISGILLETAGMGSARPSHVVIGIGINVVDHPVEALYRATNLQAEFGHEFGHEFDTIYVMQCLMTSMAYWILIWKDQGFGFICKSWKSKAYGIGKNIIIRLPHEILEGRFLDLDDRGALILEFEGKRRHITAGDVFFT